jgi:hypothetical protein
LLPPPLLLPPPDLLFPPEFLEPVLEPVDVVVVFVGVLVVFVFVVVVFVGVLVVEVELELGLEEVELPVVVVVVAGGGGGGALHDCETLAMGPGTGRAETGVPAGTVKDRCCPVTRVTDTTHVSARAVGISASACTASTVPTVARPTLSLRRLITVAGLLLPCQRAELHWPHHAADQ